MVCGMVSYSQCSRHLLLYNNTITEEETSEDTSGIPFLKDIPVVGWAFKARAKVVSKSELLIFITPTVLPPPGQTQGGR